MKTIFCFLLGFVFIFSGCDDSSPSCEEQLSDYKNCSIDQTDEFTCDEINSGGQKLGTEIGEYCKKNTMSPAFQKQCADIARQELPDTLKDLSSFLISKCLK